MGEPSHFEIGVPDPRRAQVFYSKLLGWKFNEGSRNSAAIETAGVPGGVHEATEPGSWSSSASLILKLRFGASVSLAAKLTPAGRKDQLGNTPVLAATTRACRSACTSR